MDIDARHLTFSEKVEGKDIEYAMIETGMDYTLQRQ